MMKVRTCCLNTLQYWISEGIGEGIQVGTLPLREPSVLIAFHKVHRYLYSTVDSVSRHGNPLRKSWSFSLFADTTVGVFHLRSPQGQYKMTYEKAKEACANESATVATYNQLLYAQKVR